MPQAFLEKSQVRDAYLDRSWQRILFSELQAALDSEARPFPCVYGVAGFRANDLRFAFLDKITPETLAPVLKVYIENARNFGRHASLVVFERPGPVETMCQYRDRFWSLLDGARYAIAMHRAVG